MGNRHIHLQAHRLQAQHDREIKCCSSTQSVGTAKEQGVRTTRVKDWSETPATSSLQTICRPHNVDHTKTSTKQGQGRTTEDRRCGRSRRIRQNEANYGERDVLCCMESSAHRRIHHQMRQRPHGQSSRTQPLKSNKKSKEVKRRDDWGIGHTD